MSKAERLDRAAIAQAAAALADAAGDVERVTLAQVAERLGVRIPSLYNHIAGLAGLRREVTLLSLRELTGRVQAAAIGRAAGDAIIAIARAVRAYAQAHPGRYAATIRAAGRGDQEINTLAEALIGILLQALAAYNLGEDDALHAIRGLRSVVHGFAALEAAGGFGLPLDLDESFERLLRGFVAGLNEAARRRDDEV
jgi:AcrR family transcriptional regulator